MSSSDGRRAARKARVAAEATTPAAAVSGSENGAADGAESDPWFGLGPKLPSGADSARPGDSADSLGSAAPEASTAADSVAAAAEPADRAEWFLPTGRAALMPESITVAADEDEDSQARAQYPAQIRAAGEPPWAGEVTGPIAAVPPPWETGPWPGPGEGRASVAGGPVPTGPVPVGLANGSPVSGGSTGQTGPAPWSARTVLASGLVPLVIPGLVAGAVSLRRSKAGDPVRRASILAIAASLAWAVIIVVLVASTSGGSASNCHYPAAVHQAYARAMADLRSNAPASVTVADLGQAATLANASAAATATGDIAVRSALFAMTADLQQARADVVAKHGVPSSLRAHLAADGTMLTASCPS
jgi:hypothetical protein